MTGRCQEQQSQLTVIAQFESPGMSGAGMYQDDPEATSDMAVSERSHARALTQLRGGDSDDRDVLRWCAVDGRR